MCCPAPGTPPFDIFDRTFLFVKLGSIRSCARKTVRRAIFGQDDKMLSPAFASLANAMKLFDHRTDDGSRYFSRLPRPERWDVLYDCVLRLSGAKVINHVGEDFGRPWLDFHYCGHRFLICLSEEHVQLYVDDPQCSDVLLYQVGRHFEKLLSRSKEA